MLGHAAHRAGAPGHAAPSLASWQLSEFITTILKLLVSTPYHIGPQSKEFSNKYKM